MQMDNLQLRPIESQEELEEAWYRTYTQTLDGGRKSYHQNRNMQFLLEQQQVILHQESFDYQQEFGERFQENQKQNLQFIQKSIKYVKKTQNNEPFSSSSSSSSDSEAQQEEKQPSLEDIKKERRNSRVQSLKSLINNQEQVFEDLADLNKHKWQFKENKKGINLHVIFDDKTEEICTRVQCNMTLKKGVDGFIDFVKRVENKPIYDPMFEKGAYVDDFGDDVTIQHWLLKGQAIVAPRHFSLLSKISKLEAQGLTYMVAQAVEYPEGESKLNYSIKKAVRCSVNKAGWRLKHIEGDEYEVIYLQFSNPNGNLPYFIKKATPKFSFDMVKNIKKIMEKQK